MTSTIGIDFGTSNSALAVTHNGVTEVLDISNEVLEGVRQKTLKSVLFIDEEWNSYTGQKAVQQYLFERESGRFMQSLKSFLPVTSFDSVTIYGERVTLEQLIAIILQEIKASAEKRIGGTADKVVIGRPVRFSLDDRLDRIAENRLRSAAEHAGFSNIFFQQEPVAATTAYHSRFPGTQGQVVLMGDFGGGTSDFTVMRLGSDVKDSEVLSVGGVPIGGDTFDSRIMWEKVTPYFGKNVRYRALNGEFLSIPVHLMRSLCQWHTISFMREPKTLRAIREMRLSATDKDALSSLENLILENKGILIFQAIEKAKRLLSTETAARIEYKDATLNLSLDITREEFTSFIREDLALLRDSVGKVIERSGVSKSEIDTILLTGGTSLVPAVQEIFEDIGPQKIVHLDAFTSVSEGLAQSKV